MSYFEARYGRGGTTIPAPPTLAVGDPLDSDVWNAIVVQSYDFLLGGSAGLKPSFIGTLTTAQSIPNAVITNVKLTIEEDTDNAYSASTGVYTVVTPGIYLVSGSLQWTSNTTNRRYIGIQSPTNQLGARLLAASSDSFGRMSAAIETRLEVGDYFSLTAYQDSGSALALAGTGALCSMTAIWVSA